jgi:2-isopropylmalate synthase
MIKKIKELEHEGYQFEGAEASLELFFRKNLGEYKGHFDLEAFKVTTEKRGDSDFISEAVIKIKVDDKVVHTAAEGAGPVNALDNALRKALMEFFPVIEDMYLYDYKVRVLDEGEATKSTVRVLISSRDKNSTWSTVGVSKNIIEASWKALLESMDYALLKEKRKSENQITEKNIN